jgi:alpha-D-ribose 1-methylphosphonate 5-triphosphate synthase subunit PhnH
MRREINYDEVFDAQQQFRLLLDSMAHPGRINLLPDMDIDPPSGLNKGSALIAFALLNTDVSFHASGANCEEISSYIAANTTSESVSVNDADFIFINGLHHEGILFEAKTGNLAYPEESATFVIDVEAISQQPDDNSLSLILKGPGIKTEERLFIKGIHTELLAAVKEQNTEFPLGVDLMITDRQNRVICIPRSNQFIIENATTAAAELTD